MVDAVVQPTATRSAWIAEIRSTALLSWPLILTNFAQTAFGATDVILMSRLGPATLAAGTLGGNLYFAFLIFGIGLTIATGPMLARALGERRRGMVREVRRTVRQGLWTALAYSIPVWLVLWHAEAILLAIGQEPDLSRSAATFMHALQWALFPALAYAVLRSFISSLERPLWALWIVAAAIVLNVGLNWVLMFGHLGCPPLGLTGSGLATSISNFVMFAALAAIVQFRPPFRRFHVFGRFWRADWPRFIELFRLGVPIAFTLAFEVTVFNAAVFMMGVLGMTQLAAHSIAIQISALSFMIPLGISQASTVRVGLAYGAGDREGIRVAGWSGYLLGVAIMAVAASVLLLAPRTLISGFLDTTDPKNREVVDLAVTFLACAGCFQLLDAAQVMGAGVLRGLHDTRIPMIFAAVGYWGLGLPVGALLAFKVGLGGIGIWIGLATGIGILAVLMTARWIMRERLGLVRFRTLA
ncbi:multidrug resistance protein, MATE family [Faunimonas pinastri]|uniref:Multidrug-efflux transporter n=1 Tax=Faunimonas pinastri TaxID=1855383 RepID=A0A1H9AME4_9HYPH|nr:MATE family efflux transporter [Faunimonas pinastri]SEP77890.1 multidrug resistance protein, MATE family [Faunimonas pinastri]